MKAIVLAAGFGSRMKELTASCPKPLLKIGKKAIVEHIFDRLKECGVTEVALNLHYRHEDLEDFLGDGKRFDLKIETIVEKSPSGTAGGVKSLESFLKGADKFFVVYGDIYTKQSFVPLIEAFEKYQAKGAIFLHKRKGSNSHIYIDKEGRITHFLERPSEQEMEEAEERLGNDSYVNSAIYLLDKSVLEMIPSDRSSDFPKDIFPALISRQQLWGVPITAPRVAIDTAEKLELAREIEMGRSL